MLLIDSEHIMGSGTARFLASFATLLIFLRSPEFIEMLMALSGAVQFAWPLIVLLFMVKASRHLLELIACSEQVVILCSLLGRDIFGDKVLNEFGTDTLFGNYGRALSTFFRLFLQEVLT